MSENVSLSKINEISSVVCRICGLFIGFEKVCRVNLYSFTLPSSLVFHVYLEKRPPVKASTRPLSFSLQFPFPLFVEAYGSITHLRRIDSVDVVDERHAD